MADRLVHASLSSSARAYAPVPTAAISHSELVGNRGEPANIPGQPGDVSSPRHSPRLSSIVASPPPEQFGGASRASQPETAAQPNSITGADAHTSPRLRSRSASANALDVAAPQSGSNIDISQKALEAAIKSHDLSEVRKLAAAGAQMASLSNDKSGILLDVLKSTDLDKQRCLIELGVDFVPVLDAQRMAKHEKDLRRVFQAHPDRFKSQEALDRTVDERMSDYAKVSAYWFSNDFALRDWLLHQQLIKHPEADVLSPFSNRLCASFSTFYADKLFLDDVTSAKHLPLRNELFSPEDDPAFVGSFEFRRTYQHEPTIFRSDNGDISSRIAEALFKIRTLATDFAMTRKSTGIKPQQIKALTACMLANLQDHMKGDPAVYVQEHLGFSRDATSKLIELEQRQRKSLEQLGHDGLSEIATYLEKITIIDDCFLALAAVPDDDEHALQDGKPGRAALEKSLLQVVTTKSGFSNGVAAFLIRCTLDAIDDSGKQPTNLNIPANLTCDQHRSLLFNTWRAKAESVLVDKMKEKIGAQEVLREIAGEQVAPRFEETFHRFMQWQFGTLHGFIDAMQERIEKRNG